jgi:hypothetical protein
MDMHTFLCGCSFRVSCEWSARVAHVVGSLLKVLGLLQISKGAVSCHPSPATWEVPVSSQVQPFPGPVFFVP